jgi:hypothetical protein
LGDNEAATSLAIVSFAFAAHHPPTEPLLVVGSAKDAFVQPRTCKNGFLRVYRFVNDGKAIELVHKVLPLFLSPLPPQKKSYDFVLRRDGMKTMIDGSG